MSTIENQTPPIDSPEYADLAHTGSQPPVEVEPSEAPRVDERLSVPEGYAREKSKPPLGLAKFKDRLPQPPVIRAWRRFGEQPIRIRAEKAFVRLHADLPRTVAWTYEGSMPGPTIEVRSGREARIDWENCLSDEDGPLHLPFDVVRVPSSGGNPNIPGALISGGRVGTDPAAGAFPRIEGTKELTAATVVHLHGALTDGHNDGWAHNVALPGNVTRCAYPNKQSARTLWYHDHAMAVTRYNVHAGLAGFYLIRDEREERLRLPSGEAELVLAITDRNLETDERGCFTGRVLYKQAGFEEQGNPGEIPFIGPYTLVNGKIWPTTNVDARWYRLRLLNASNSRVMRLALHDTTDERPDAEPVLSTDPAFARNRIEDALVVIGTEGGFLGAPARPEGGVLEMGPGERADVLVDFSALRGRTVELRNESGTVIDAGQGQAEASVMQFVVDRRRVRDPFVLPPVLDKGYSRWVHRPDGVLEVGQGRTVDHHAHAWVAIIPSRIRGAVHPQMWEMEQIDGYLPIDTPDIVRVTGSDGEVVTLRPVAKLFDDTTTIRFAEQDWAVWNILHLGGPDHPLHIHMTDFQMISRRQWEVENGAVKGFDKELAATPAPLPTPAPGRAIDAIDAGQKDTWVIKSGEWVSTLGQFAGATGSFMYHCHILDHEDHTMMRPFVVLPKSILAFHTGHAGGHH